MKRLLVASALCLVLTVSKPAVAADETGIYLAPKLIWSQQQHDNVREMTNSWTFPTIYGYGGASKDAQAWGGALALGYDFQPKLSVPVRVELEYAQREQSKATFHVKDTSALGILFGERYDTTRKMTVSTLFANAFFDIPTGTSFTPYVGGGVGAASIRVKDDMTDTFFGYVHSNSAERTNFAWNLGAGVAYSFDNNWKADLGYRYCDFGPVKGSQDVRGAGYAYQSKSKVTAHEVLLGLRYGF